MAFKKKLNLLACVPRKIKCWLFRYQYMYSYILVQCTQYKIGSAVLLYNALVCIVRDRRSVCQQLQWQ